jgi:hypothetical protein
MHKSPELLEKFVRRSMHGITEIPVVVENILHNLHV